MHEAAYGEAIVGAVNEHASGRRVRRIRLRVGAAHRISPDALDVAVASAARGTAVDGAALDVVVEPIVAMCRACGATSHLDDPWGTCTACGSADVDATGGRDLRVESIEIDDA